MTKAKKETQAQKDRRNERNRQRRKVAAAARATAKLATKPVEATKPATMTIEAIEAPKPQPAATRAPTVAQRAVAIGFKMGVNGKLIDLEGCEFFPFYPDDLLSSQSMLHNDAAIRGRAVGALEELTDFFASRVTGRMMSRTEMKLARLIESLANELAAVADEIPAILTERDDLRRERDQARAERDDLQEYKEDLIRQFSRFHGQYALIDVPPQEPEAKPAKQPMKRVDLIRSVP